MAHIRGTAENNVLTGTSADDLIEGRAGSDTLTGGAGDDTLNGGPGTDTASYAGILANYALLVGTPAGGGFTVTDLNSGNGNEGRDLVAGCEKLRFADATIDVAWSPAGSFKVVNAPFYGWSYQVETEGLAGGGFVVTYSVS